MRIIGNGGHAKVVRKIGWLYEFREVVCVVKQARVSKRVIGDRMRPVNDEGLRPDTCRSGNCSDRNCLSALRPTLRAPRTKAAVLA